MRLRGGRPAWSTAVGLGPIPYRFAGSNPASRTLLSDDIYVREHYSARMRTKRELNIFQCNNRSREGENPASPTLLSDEFYARIPNCFELSFFDF